MDTGESLNAECCEESNDGTAGGAAPQSPELDDVVEVCQNAEESDSCDEIFGGNCRSEGVLSAAGLAVGQIKTVGECSPCQVTIKVERASDEECADLTAEVSWIKGLKVA